MAVKPNYLQPGNRYSPNGQVFWQGLAAGRFLAPRCDDCGELFFPPRPVCPECLGDRLKWEELSGRGTLYSWTEMYYARPEFDTPFLLGLIDLEEGIGRIAARIEGASAQDLFIGQKVEIESVKVSDDFHLYQARPRTRLKK